jgi:Asp-tRNA(Asn)/Glu-tRNA(Gln) amidotransferase A subunit family amidase
MRIARRAKPTALLARLDEFEKFYADKEPHIHAFLEEPDRFARLRREALQLANKNRKPEKRGPLFGLLLGVKDMFQVDGFATHAGSRLPARELKGREAESVGLLKRAGMLVAGKTHTTEFAYFAPGPTRNPNNPEYTPGGSSSGSAAAVAAGLVDLALGTQTIGSVIRPASYCGVVGYKPSYGRISTEGVIPLARSLDHVGLFAHDVSTAARGAAVLVTDWKKQKASTNKPYLAVVEGEYLQLADEEMRLHFENIVERLKQAGYSVKRVNALPNFAKVVERHNTILGAQAAQAHAAWFAGYSQLYHEKTAELIKKGMNIPEDLLKKSLDDARSFSLSLTTQMDIHGIDLWISPAATGAAPKGLTSTGDPVMNLPWTQAGLPTLGIPSGRNAAGMPLGFQMTADFNRDEDLFAWGAEIESLLAEKE